MNSIRETRPTMEARPESPAKRTGLILLVTEQRYCRRKIRIRRLASIELDWLLGRRGYPDVEVVYPTIVSRELEVQ